MAGLDHGDFQMSEFFSEQQFYNGISTEYQPDIEDAGQIEGFGSGLFEFVYAGFCTERRHGHGK